MAYEHTEFTSGPEIRLAAESAGIGLVYDYDTTFFPFADYRTGEDLLLPDCADARQVTVRHSAKYQSAFRYDEADRAYRMEMYSARTGHFEPAVDELNGAGGEAFLFTRGRVRPCQWAKPAPDLPLEVSDNGQPVTLNRGRTYLAIVDEDEREAFAFNA